MKCRIFYSTAHDSISSLQLPQLSYYSCLLVAVSRGAGRHSFHVIFREMNGFHELMPVVLHVFLPSPSAVLLLAFHTCQYCQFLIWCVCVLHRSPPNFTGATDLRQPTLRVTVNLVVLRSGTFLNIPPSSGLYNIS